MRNFATALLVSLAVHTAVAAVIAAILAHPQDIVAPSLDVGAVELSFVENPDSPDSPEILDSPDNPDNPDIPDIPDIPDNPDNPDIPDIPESPEDPDNPDNPDNPDDPDNPDIPDIPDIPDNPDNPDIPDIPESPDIPDSPDSPENPESPENPIAQQNPDVPNTPPTTEPCAPAKPSDVEQARVDAPPRPLREIRPEYPKESRLRREEGDVTLLLGIDARGHVSSAEIAVPSGFPELDAAAVRAALKARFSPARIGRTAVPSSARITIRFRLSR